MKTYWQDTEAPITGEPKLPRDSSIAIIGSGLAGVSVAYWLLEKTDFKNIQIIDCGSEEASFFRNAGHILHGTGESYKAMTAIHGRENAKKIMSLSERFCYDIENTVVKLGISDYRRGNYYFIGSSQHEEDELAEAVSMMVEDGANHSAMIGSVEPFKNLYKARRCFLSAHGHPVKFRNSVLRYIKEKGIEHVSCKVNNLEDTGDKVRLEHPNGHSDHDFVVVCTNAYTNLLCPYVRDRGLIEPFKGQIIVSEPMSIRHDPIAFSSDHGYMYGMITPDNRVLIGGWRNNVDGMESNTYDLSINPAIEEGLKGWVDTHMDLGTSLDWKYSWSGIMGSSSNKGLPIIGHMDSQRTWVCAGFTGYGFGWAHGSARFLVEMMTGEDVSDSFKLFDPRTV